MLIEEMIGAALHNKPYCYASSSFLQYSLCAQRLNFHWLGKCIYCFHHTTNAFYCLLSGAFLNFNLIMIMSLVELTLQLRLIMPILRGLKCWPRLAGEHKN